MNLKQTQFMFILTAVVFFNILFFSFAGFKKYKRKYKTFYSCQEKRITRIYNGLEFKMYKLKFEKFNKMSPHCQELE
jgi:hypothetical protein